MGREVRPPVLAQVAGDRVPDPAGALPIVVDPDQDRLGIVAPDGAGDLPNPGQCVLSLMEQGIPLEIFRLQTLDSTMRTG